ncbi:MAG: septation protein IspZ [Alcanivoracaceae bacterium]|nr:septation protein IspZ [Alcanivoracaceae bacterium]
MPVHFKIFLKPLIVALFLAYPFIIYYGLLKYALWQIALVISVLAGLRAFVFKDGQSQIAKIGFYGSLCLMAFSFLSIVLNNNGWLKLYPIIISLMFFVVFFSSLFSDKTTIQRFAEIKEKNIDAKKQSYMYKLTIIWCVFFVINMIISTYTMLYLSFQQWTLYNGFISYIIMGLLIVIELAYRHIVVLRK